MKKLLVLLPLVVLGVVAWWMVGEPSAADRVERRGADAGASPPRATELRDVETDEAQREAARAVDAAADADAAAAGPASRSTQGALHALAIVMDSTGRRLQGAEVRWKSDDEVDSTLTDAKGVARIPKTPPLSTRLSASLAGYATTRIRAYGYGPFRLKLRRLTSLAGRVLEAQSHAPLEGVRLTVSWRECPECPPEVAVSGPGGAYAFAALPAGTDLEILAEGPEIPAQRSGLRLEARGAEAHAHDVLLERGVRLRGTIFDLVTGAPIAAAHVFVQRYGKGVTTDTAGFFELPVAEFDAKAVLVEHPDYCPLEVKLQDSQIDLTAPVRFPLVQAATIEGFVRDDNGEALSGVAVIATSSEARRLMQIGYVGGSTAPDPDDPPTPLAELPSHWRMRDQRRAPATSDAEGRYTLDGLLPWQPVSLLALKKGFERTQTEALSTPEPNGRLRRDLELGSSEPQPTVVGHLSVNGRPVHGHVRWIQGTSSGSAMVIRNPFKIKGLAPGVVELEAHPFRLHTTDPGFRDLERQTRTIELPDSGETRVDFDVRMTMAPIGGVVVNEVGEAVPGVTVRASVRASVGVRSALSDDDGLFELEVPARDEPYEVTAHFDNRAVATTRRIQSGARDAVLVLPRLGRLLIRATDVATGAGLELSVHGRQAPEGWRRQRLSHPNPAGWRELAAPVGLFDVRILDAAGQFIPHETTVNLTADGPTRLDVELRRGLIVKLRFDPPLPDKPNFYLLPQALWASGPPSWRTLGAAIGSDPRFKLSAGPQDELRGLAPGRYRPAAWVDGEPLDIVWLPDALEISAEKLEHTLSWTRRR